nr:uncharacterized protein LOC115261172 [Aedes albopictus]
MQGCKVVVMSGNGVQYTRSINDIRKPPRVESTESVLEDTATSRDTQLEPESSRGSFPLPELEETVAAQPLLTGVQQSQRQLRTRGALKRPAKYNDNFVYRVYQ